MWKHYLAGVVPGLMLNVISALYFGSYAADVINQAIFLLPFGLLAGFINHMVARAKSNPPPQNLRDVAISFVLGILFLVVGLFVLVFSCFGGWC